MSKFVKAALAVCAMSVSSFALFVNGGFEDGTMNGWNVKYGTFTGGSATNPYAGINWSSVLSDQPKAKVIDNSFTMTGLNLNIDPYVGNKMALLNDYYGDYHATEIWQQDVIDADDIANGAQLYVDWGVVLENPSHGAGYDPFFGATVTINGVVAQTVYANSGNAAAAGSGWTVAGGYAATSYYKSGQWAFDLSNYAVGSTVKVDLFVSDCGYGGHGAYAFLDGVGTVKPPEPQPVPEPGLISLFAIGLVSLSGARFIRKRK